MREYASVGLHGRPRVGIVGDLLSNPATWFITIPLILFMAAIWVALGTIKAFGKGMAYAWRLQHPKTHPSNLKERKRS